MAVNMHSFAFAEGHCRWLMALMRGCSWRKLDGNSRAIVWFGNERDGV